jgi:tetratricopeptide (TPR) repeat protein
MHMTPLGRRRYLLLLAVLLAAVSCASVPPNEQRIDNIPMYGQPAIPRPPELLKADAQFIESAVAGMGSREKAAVAWAIQGDEFMAGGELHMAMRRYNQAWLLDPGSFRPYWGFGRVMLARGAFTDALEYFDRAVALCNDPFQKVALLSDAGTAYSGKAASLPAAQAGERDVLFRKANALFSESAGLEPGYGNVYFRWAQSLYREGRYKDAWEKVRLARANKYPVPEGFVRGLAEKHPEADR